MMHPSEPLAHLITLPRLGAKMTAQVRKSGPTPRNWGNHPWQIDFCAEARELPDSIDFAIVGGGFTGLSAAARLAAQAPAMRVAVFEAETVGAGASGHTGGLALAETAAGDMPGLGDVLKGVSEIVEDLKLDCDFDLSGAWEVEHVKTRLRPRSTTRRKSKEEPKSTFSWKDDTGILRVSADVPGGAVDPGKLVSGLAKAAAARGALIFEGARVEDIRFDHPVVLTVRSKEVRAEHVLIATNAASLELSGLANRAESKFTLALATEPLEERQLQALGMDPGKPFYTNDLPYLWGRTWKRNRIILGSGLVHLSDWHELLTLDVNTGQAAKLMNDLERRVRNLHPAFKKAKITHKWGGPILIADKWQPIFGHHPKSERTIVVGAYSGHGVMLSVYFGAWAADVMQGRRSLPAWNSFG
jgi:glycine/D-amino acid oxidase-like deaminating enzyme